MKKKLFNLTMWWAVIGAAVWVGGTVFNLKSHRPYLLAALGCRTVAIALTRIRFAISFFGFIRLLKAFRLEL